jgi:Flp pilus assembly protein TadG
MMLFKSWRKFNKAEGGAAGTEFALLASLIMVPLLLGSVELLDVLGVNKRAQNSAASLADIVARDTEVSNAEVQGLWSALDVLMYPDRSDDMRITLTSVRIVNSTSARVVWSEAHGDGASARGVNDPVTLDARMMVPGTSIIMAETDYSYRPPLRFLFPGNVSISHAAYRRSRLVDPIPRVS